MNREAALERALVDLTFGECPAPSDPGSVDRWLQATGVHPDDAPWLRAELGRLLLYRTLAAHTIRETVAQALPRTVARLEARFDESVRRFLEQRGPRSACLRDVVAEWLEHASAWLETLDDVPAYVVEVARLEATHARLIAALDDEPAPVAALSLDLGVRWSRASELCAFRHAVHRLPLVEENPTRPEAVPALLLLYRDASFEVRTLELTPAAFSAFSALRGGAPLRDAVQEARRAAPGADDDALLSGLAATLADLAERGVVLGGASPLV